MKIKHLILILVLAAALGLASCTRSASEAPTLVPGTDATQTGTEQQPPSNMETAVAGGGFATQTAQAAVTTPGEPAEGETPGGEATATPVTGSEATPVPLATPTTAPTDGTEPTQAPPVAPTEPAASSSCTSPYTVQSGEWIWSIGRKCNISPQAIINANPTLACYYDYSGTLQCPVYAGTQLILPAGAPPFTGP